MYKLFLGKSPYEGSDEEIQKQLENVFDFRTKILREKFQK
jgi:hypothetical protein